MKPRFLFIISAMLMAATSVSTSAQKHTLADTIAARSRMVKTLLGENPGPVQAEVPYKDNDYMPYSAETPNLIIGNKYTNYLLQLDQSAPMQAQESGKANYYHSDYYYVASHGCTSAKSYGVMFYVEFTKSQFQIVRCSTRDGEQKRSGIFFYNTSVSQEAPDFTEKSYLEPLREKTTANMDIVNNWVSNDTRRNEIFQSFIDLNTMDYNDDGIDDLMLVVGNTLHIIDGSTLEEIAKKQITTDVDCSPSSVVYDFNDDGIDDYLCMIAHTSDYANQTDLKFDGVIAASKYADDGTLSYSLVDKTMSAADLASGSGKTMRGTMAMQLVYPESRWQAPMLAIAVTDCRYNGIQFSDTIKNDTTKLNLGATLDANKLDTLSSGYNIIYLFDEYLSMVNISSAAIGQPVDNWYRVDAKKNEEIRCNRTTNSGYLFGHCEDRRRPFLFGRPALSGAFTDGWDNPQQIFWINSVYGYNPNTKAFSQAYVMPNQHDWQTYNNDNGFDRIVGGQIESVRTTNGFSEGKEAFAFISAESKNQYDKGTLYDDFDWADSNYKFGALWRASKTSDWTLVTPYTLSADSARFAIALGKIAKDKGAKMKLISSEVTCSNPIISYVLAAPPYVKGLTTSTGSVMFSQSSSESASETKAYTECAGGGTEDGKQLNILSLLKIGTRKSLTKSWSNSTSQTISSGEERASGTSAGIDYVVFNYMPADLFTYEITECEAVPEMVGTKFHLTKVRDAGIMQKGMPVSEFNAMVEGTTCPQIKSDVLSHTVGYVGSYHKGLYNESAIRKAFNVADSDYFRISQVVAVPEESATERITLSYGKGGSESYSEATHTDVALAFSLGPIEWSFGRFSWMDKWIDKDKKGDPTSWDNSWSQTKSWNNSYSITAVLPNVTNPSTNYYTYCLVWYQHRVKNADGQSDSQNYMVANWYVLDDQTTPSKTLAEILSEGKDGYAYTISDDLTAPYVSADGSTVYAKDDNNYSPRQDQGSKSDPWNNAAFDQSNWIKLVGDSTMAGKITGNNRLLPGGTIAGILSHDNNGNPIFTVISGELDHDISQGYSPNMYRMANFALVQPAEAQNYFLVTPKPYEYLTVKGAALSADTTTFYMPASDGNGAIGQAKIDWSLCGNKRDRFTYTNEEHKYNFTALVYRGSQWPSTLPSEATADGGWIIAPISGLEPESPTSVNGVNNDNREVQSVTYVDMAGREYNKAPSGMYVKVTRYTDGTTSSQKMVK